MDFSKLSQNDKLAMYGAAAVIVGGLVGYGAGGFGILAVAAAVGMLVVVFLPQLSPSTNLPGSKGSLMAALGGIAAVVLVLGLLSLLTALGFMLSFAPIATIFYLIAVGGGVLMAWAGWQEFQREGGKWQFGTGAAAGSGTAGSADSSAATDAPASDPHASNAAETHAHEPAAETHAHEPAAETHADEDPRPQP
jgi:hypothetical protein